MKLAYLLAAYPMTSTTFIRHEIEAVEEALVEPVKRFACREWDLELVDPHDLIEQARTEYLITRNALRLIAGALFEAVVRLPRLVGVLRLWWRVYCNAGGDLARHLGYLVQALYFHRRTRALGIGHVHAHFSTNAACVAMLAHALGGPPYSFTVHGPDELVDPAGASMGEKVAHAAFVAAITDYCRMRVEQEAPAHTDRITIIPCGIDLASFAWSVPDPAHAHRLVCVGRLCPNKAQTLIPPAVAAVRDQYPDISVELIGDGELRPQIEAEIARLGLAAHVRLNGWAANAAVRDAIACSSALLLPTLAEGLPIVIMEALALGRPVLTTYVAGIPELVDEGCGWIFPSGSLDDLIAALRGFLASTPEKRAAMGMEGRRRVEERHDLHRSARLLVALFRERGGLSTA